MSDPVNGHPRDLLSGYLDDELSLEERASVDRHLAVCEECREELAALRGLAHALAGESVPPLSVDLEARIGRRLDAATIARPRRWRFALPATIAATVGAIGLLVVLQWPHEGRHVVPSAPAPTPTQRELDRAMPSYAPTPEQVPKQGLELQREKSATRVDALKKDLAATPEQKLERDAERAPADAPAGVPGVVGGVAGGVEDGVKGGVPGETGGSATGEASSADARRERVAAKAANEAPTLMRPASVPAAKSESRSPCSEQWSDAGLRAAWEVQDVTIAVRELNVMARDVGGVGVWRGVADGGPYVLAVPRGRFDEVFFALRARGVTGLVEPPAAAAGNDCAGISIVLTVAARPASPTPR